MTTRQSVIIALERLISEFHLNPHDFFSERELHSRFYCLARQSLPHAVTDDKDNPCEISCFRQEYNTVWRYKRKRNSSGVDEATTLSFQRRLESEGKPGSFDFAIIKPDFVSQHSLLSVINKDERRRRALRSLPTGILQFVIEFKMGHIRSSITLSSTEFKTVIKGMKEDARKCGHEAPEIAVLLGFFHSWPLNYKPDCLIREIEEELLAASDVYPSPESWIYLISSKEVFRSVHAPSLSQTQ